VSVQQRPHALYRFFSAEERLLYVGITCNPSPRFKKHALEKDWWADVARIAIEHFPDRTSALNAERKAIQAEKPSHNIMLNGNGAQTPPAKPRIVGLVGRFFHTWRDPAEAGEHSTIIRGRALNWQGHVVDQIDDAVYLVELFSWLDGCPTDTQIATLDDMRSWTFYDSSLEMQIALPCGQMHDSGRRCRNEVTHYHDLRRVGFGIQFVCHSCADRYPGFRDYPEIQWKNGKPVCA
jgi:hypothetical protein